MFIPNQQPQATLGKILMTVSLMTFITANFLLATSPVEADSSYPLTGRVTEQASPKAYGEPHNWHKRYRFDHSRHIYVREQQQLATVTPQVYAPGLPSDISLASPIT